MDSKRWRVDISGVRDAVLSLSSINLASGEQRMKTHEDQLSMRTLFQENDLICAEIQNISAEGVISLHSRSLKYGKLENGQLLIVPAALVRRLPQHYISLPSGVDVILGKNCYIWVTRSMPESWKQESEDMRDDITPLAETLQRLRVKHCETPLTAEERVKVVRTRNAILAISKSAEQEENRASVISVTPDNIMTVYNKSIDMKMQPKVSMFCWDNVLAFSVFTLISFVHNISIVQDMLQLQCALALVHGLQD